MGDDATRNGFQVAAESYAREQMEGWPKVPAPDVADQVAAAFGNLWSDDPAQARYFQSSAEDLGIPPDEFVHAGITGTWHAFSEGMVVQFKIDYPEEAT